MAQRLQPPDTNALLKRTRSAESSNRATPAAEKVPDPEDASLPRFLQQTDAEIDEKFDHLDLRQRDRLDDSRVKPVDSLWTQSASNEHRVRNRYFDIRPWDQTRVKLKVPEGSSDYINASPILLQCSRTNQSRRYIATQGPKETSMEHFWQMVWHETDHVAVVIMLTQLTEGFREKCFKYYPEDSGSEPIGLNFTNENGEELTATLCVVESAWHESSMTMVRTLRLSCNQESKLVHHLFFQGWPDYGVPEASDRVALLDLIRLSRDKNFGWENPRIVHCSAGVGRTGSFIAIEHLLAELEAGSMDNLSESDDPVFNTIESLRQQRMTMVQSVVQYRFIYELLAEAGRARVRERAIAEKMEGMTTGTQPSGSGEPAHKAMKFTRAMRGVWSNLRSHSRSQNPRGDWVQDISIQSPAEHVSSSDAEQDQVSLSPVKDAEEQLNAPSDMTTPEVFHDAPENLHSNEASEPVFSLSTGKISTPPPPTGPVPEIVDTKVDSQLPDAMSPMQLSQESGNGPAGEPIEGSVETARQKALS